MDTSATNPAIRGYLDFSGMARLRGDASRDQTDAVREAATQFEATFIQMMLSAMREAGLNEDLTSGPGQAMYTDLMDREVAAQMARRRSFGVAQMIERQLAPGAAPGAEPAAGPAASAAPASTSEVLGAREAARTPGLPLRPPAAALPLQTDGPSGLTLDRPGALPLAPREAAPATQPGGER
jgi:flagellar protein FlgJ